MTAASLRQSNGRRQRLRQTWSGFPAARSAWDRTGIIRKRRRSIASAVDGFWIDRTPVTNRQFKEFVNATGYVTFAEIAARSEGLSRCVAAHALCWLAGLHTAGSSGRSARIGAQWWTFLKGANWRHPYGPKQQYQRRSTIIRSCTSPLPTRRLREMGRQGTADRSRMGICRARRPRRRRVRLGRRVHARRQASGEYLAGRISRSRTAATTASRAPRR